jgi:hypothetical protein
MRGEKGGKIKIKEDILTTFTLLKVKKLPNLRKNRKTLLSRRIQHTKKR